MRRPAALVVAVVGAAVGASLSCEAPRRAPLASDLDRADSVVRAWVEDGRIPGAVLHVSRPTGETFVRAYGWAHSYEYGAGQYRPGGTEGSAEGLRELETPIPMTPETVFDLASVTKVVGTTMAVMLLAGSGALDLDAPVRSYLPDFVGGGKERVTARHLLTHRSGLAQWWPLYYRASTPAEAYAHILELPLQWPVGEERRYSDLGFMVLGLLVERVSGTPLEAFLEDRLYAPLGLTETGFRPAGAERSGDGEAVGGPYAATSHGNPFEHRMVHDPDFGYRIDVVPASWDGWRRRTLVGEVNDGNAHHAFGGVAGHAGLFSTAAELDALLRLLIGRGELNGRRLLEGAIVDAFLESSGDGQALGWQIPAYAPPTAAGHSGFTGTFVLADGATGLALVLLTNRQHAGVGADTTYPDVGPLQQAVTVALLGDSD